MLLKATLALVGPFLLLLIGWGTWVTVTLFALKSGTAIIESRQPAAVTRETSVDAKLDDMHKELTEIRLLLTGHIASDPQRP